MSGEVPTRVSVTIAGSESSFETGRSAKQASGAVVVRQGEGNFVINPDEALLSAMADEAGERSDLDLVVAGTEDAILMVEAGANEIPEAEILDALDIAHSEIKKICAAQRELAEKVGREKKEFEVIGVDEAVLEEVRSRYFADLDAATQVEDKLDRQDACKTVEAQVIESLAPAAPEGASEEQLHSAKERRAAVLFAFEKLEKSTIRQRIAAHKKPPAG